MFVFALLPLLVVAVVVFVAALTYEQMKKLGRYFPDFVFVCLCICFCSCLFVL